MKKKFYRFVLPMLVVFVFSSISMGNACFNVTNPGPEGHNGDACPGVSAPSTTVLAVKAAVGNLGYLTAGTTTTVFNTHRNPTYTPIQISQNTNVDQTTPGTVLNGILAYTAGSDNPAVNITALQPSVGSVTVAPIITPNGAYTYTPSGADYRTSFLYAVSGTKGDVTYGVVTIDVGQSGAGQAMGDMSLTVPENQATPGTLPPQIISLVQPAYGTVLWTPGQSAYTYTPPANYSGTDVFAVLVQTAGNAQQFVRINVTIAPAALSSASFEVHNSVSGQVTFSAATPAVYGDSTFTFDKTDVSKFPNDGDFDIYLKMTDLAGQSASDSSHVKIDNTPPTCTWLDPASNAIVHGGINATVDASDNMSGVRGVDFVDPLDAHHSPFVSISQTSKWLYSTYDTREKEGAVSLSAVVYDVAGNVNTCAQPVMADNIAPTGGLSFNPALLTYNGLSLIRGMNTVSASGSDAAGTGIASTALSLDGTVLTSANSDSVSSPVSTAGLQDGSHSFSAAFTDHAGNAGTAAAAIIVDNSAPIVAVINPVNGVVVSAILNSVSAEISEANGIIEKKVLIDNVGVAYTEQNGVFQLVSPVVTNGAHTVTVTAKDTVGNIGQDQHAFVIVNGTGGGTPPDGSPITITVIGQHNGSVLPGNTSTPITVIVTGGDGSPITVTTQIDGGTPTTMTPGPGGTFTSPVNTTGMSDGSHTITYTATNSQGQPTTVTITVIVDNTPSVLTVTSPTDGQTVSNTVDLNGVASDNNGSGVASLDVYVDGQLVTNVTGSGNSASVGYVLDTHTLSNGNHIFEFRATDRAGNVSSVERHVTVQNGPSDSSSLVINVVYPTDGLSLSGGFYATVVVTGGPDSVGVRVDGASAIALTSLGDDHYQVLLNVTQFSEGFHSLTFVAANSGGSISQTVQVYFDKTAPTLSISSPTVSSTLALVQTLVAQAGDSGRPLESVRFVLNGTTDLAFLPGNADVNSTTYSYQWDTSAVPDGDYTLTVIAKDKSGLSTQSTVPFHINNTNIPVSPATVEFRYSNAVASMQTGTFFVGPITSVSAIISNATLNPAAVTGGSFQVFVTKDGGLTQITSDRVSVDGNSIKFDRPIPANARVKCVVRVLDSNNKLIQRTAGADGSVISAMAADQGGTVLAAADGMLKLNVPVHALSQDALVEISLVPSNSPALSKVQTPNSQFSQDQVVYGPFDIEATDANNNKLPNFASIAALEFSRTAAQMKPLDAGQVDRTERFDSGRNIWDPLDSGSASLAGISDVPQSRTINASVVALGIYRIISIPKPGDGVSELIAYPSPLRAGAENATIDYLLGDNADCDVVIYDVLGNLVRHFHFSAGSNGARLINEITWDGRNGAGDVVANGAYIIQVTSTGHRARTKIGVAK